MGENQPVRGGVGPGLVVVSNTANNDGANSPEHLQHLRRRSSQSHWHNFGTVCGRIGDENAPRDAFQDLRCEEYTRVVAKIEHKDEGIQGHETANSCPSIPDPTRNGTCEKNTDKSADWPTTLECRLPGSFNNVISSHLAVYTEVTTKLFRSDELAHQEYTIRLHNLSQR